MLSPGIILVIKYGTGIIRIHTAAVIRTMIFTQGAEKKRTAEEKMRYAISENLYLLDFF